MSGVRTCESEQYLCEQFGRFKTDPKLTDNLGRAYVGGGSQG